MSDLFRERSRSRARAVRRGRRAGVLVPSFWWTTWLLVPLAVPTLMVTLPVAVMIVLSAIPAIGDAGVLVNNRFILVSPLPRWVLALWAVPVFAHIVMFPALVLIAGGAMLGKSVPPFVALRTVLRRAPAVLTLSAIVLLLIAALVAAWLALVSAIGTLWVLGFPLLVILTPEVMRCLLAVPAVMLERRPVWQALARAYHVGGDRLWYPGLTLLIGLFGIPVLAWWGLFRLLAELPDSIATTATGVGFAVMIVLTGAFQAVVVVRLFLVLLSADGEEPAAGGITGMLPDAPPASRRSLWAFTALTLPVLLCGGTVLVNPMGWAEVTEAKVAAGRAGGKREAGEPGGALDLDLSRTDLLGLYAGHDRPPLMVTQIQDGRLVNRTALITCGDPTCQDATLTWVTGRNEVRSVAGSVRLADGRLVLAVWKRAPDADAHMVQLGLLICDREQCAPPEGGGPLSEPVPEGWQAAAIALRPNGGLVIAHVRRHSYDVAREVVSFTFCGDPICSRPAQTMSADLKSDPYANERALAVAVGADGRPVAARMDPRTSAVYVLTCADRPPGRKSRSGVTARSSSVAGPAASP